MPEGNKELFIQVVSQLDKPAILSLIRYWEPDALVSMDDSYQSLLDYYDPKLIYSEEDLKGVDMQ
jgi:hypothetical protein